MRASIEGQARRDRSRGGNRRSERCRDPRDRRRDRRRTHRCRCEAGRGGERGLLRCRPIARGKPTRWAPRCASHSISRRDCRRPRAPPVPTSAAPRPIPRRACSLAQLILEELEAELGVRGRLQRLTGAMLRETRMPAVQVEPVFITNAVEAALLARPGVRRADRPGGRGRRRAGSSRANARRRRQTSARARGPSTRADHAPRRTARSRSVGGVDWAGSRHRGGYATRRCATA